MGEPGGNGAARAAARSAARRARAREQQPRWLLLIYTVPAEPSRKRAYVWRELKKLGAIYLRDGVAVLPQTDATAAAFGVIAQKIEEEGGQATLVADVRLDAARAAAIEAAAQSDRAAEYGELRQEAERFVEHVERERRHREFTYPEVESLDADLRKLRHWAEQIRARDYFAPAGGETVDALLERCEDLLAAFVEDASRAASAADEAPM